MFSMHKFIEIEKIYLDSNIVIRYFKNLIRKKNKKLPFILSLLSSNPSFKLITSSWTFAEVFEVMQKEFNLNPKEISKLYKSFIKDSKAEIINNFQLNSSVMKIVRRNGLEAKDALHLLISKKKNLAFLTADKKLIKKGIEKYQNIVTPEEIILEFSDFLRVSKN